MNYIPSEPKQAYIYICMYVVIDIFSYSYFHSCG